MARVRERAMMRQREGGDNGWEGQVWSSSICPGLQQNATGRPVPNTNGDNAEIHATRGNYGATFPQACSLSHSAPYSSYSARVTRAALAASVPAHSAIPRHASRAGSAPPTDPKILSGARNGRRGVSVLRIRGRRFGSWEQPPVRTMHCTSTMSWMGAHLHETCAYVWLKSVE